MRSSLWNDADLKPPPNLTCKMTSDEVSFSDLRKLSDAFWDALSVLQKNEALTTEAATLSRLVHRMKYVFRSDKGFKSAEKVNHCLQRYMSLNLAPVFDNFFRTIPWNASEKNIYCPTRQMLQHILLRSQGLAALLCRIVHICLDAAFHFKSRISCGQHWHVSLICLGVISRVWAIAKYLLDSCIKWYSSMLPYLNILKPFGQSWLPEGHSFPSDLTKWLSVPGADIKESPVESESFQIPNIECESSLDVKSNVQQETPSLLIPRVQALQDDIGTSILRTSFVTSPRQSENLQIQTDFDDVGVSVSRTSVKLEKHGSEEVSTESSVGAGGKNESLKKTSGGGERIKKGRKRKSKVLGTPDVTSTEGSGNLNDTSIEKEGAKKKKRRKSKVQGTIGTVSENSQDIKVDETIAQSEGNKKKMKRKLGASKLAKQSGKDVGMNETVGNKGENKKKKNIKLKSQRTSATTFSQVCEMSETPSQSKRKKKTVQPTVINVGKTNISREGKNTEITMDTGGVSLLPVETQNNIIAPGKKKMDPKVKNLNEALSSIKSQSDVQSLLSNENKKRTLTSSLDNSQWMLLKNSINKLHLKLKKAHDEKQKHQVIEQIKKAFKVALS